MQIGNNRKKDRTIYLILLLAFYLLNIYSPFINDDYYYSFIMDDGLYTNVPHCPIDDVGDIWKSQCWAYMNHNGRFIIHSIVQLFCGILGLRLFQVVNAIVFLLLIIGLTRIIRYRYSTEIGLDIILPTFLIFVSIPKIGVTFLGNISCSVNYLWTSCAMIWFIYLLYNDALCTKSCYYYLLPFAVVVGSMQESFSIGVSAVLGIYMLVQWKELNFARKLMIMGFILGTVVCVLAPSNFMRLTSLDGGSLDLMRIIWRTVRVALSLRVFWLMLAYVSLMCLLSKERLKSISREYWLIIGACLINAAFAAVVAMTGKHQLVSIELFSIVIVVCLFYDNHYDFIKKYSSSLFKAIAIIGSMLYVPALWSRQAIYEGQREVVNGAMMAHDGVVIGKEYERLCMSTNWFVTRFTRQDNYYDFNKKGLSLYLTDGEDAHYINSVLPEDEATIISMCKQENLLSDGVYKDIKYPFYVIRVPAESNDKMQYNVGLKPGAIGGLLYSLVYGNKNYADEKSGWVRDCNSFVVDNYTYAIVQDTSPIKWVSIVQDK